MEVGGGRNDCSAAVSRLGRRRRCFFWFFSIFFSSTLPILYPHSKSTNTHTNSLYLETKMKQEDYLFAIVLCSLIRNDLDSACVIVSAPVLSPSYRDWSFVPAMIRWRTDSCTGLKFLSAIGVVSGLVRLRLWCPLLFFCVDCAVRICEMYGLLVRCRRVCNWVCVVEFVNGCCC